MAGRGYEGLRIAAHSIMGVAEEFGKLEAERNRALMETAWHVRVQDEFLNLMEDLNRTPYMTDDNDENGLINDAGEDVGAQRLSDLRDRLLSEAQRSGQDQLLQVKKTQALAAHYLQYQTNYATLRDQKYKEAAGESFVGILNEQLPVMINGSDEERANAERIVEATRREYVDTGAVHGEHAASLVQSWKETAGVTRYKKNIDANLTYERLIANPREIPFMKEIDELKDVSEPHKLELKNYAIQVAHRVVAFKDLAEAQAEKELHKGSRALLLEGLDLADKGQLTDRASVMDWARTKGLNNWTPENLENLIQYVQGGGAMDWMAVADYMKAPTAAKLNALHKAGKVTNQFWLHESQYFRSKADAEKFNVFQDPVMLSYHNEIQGFVHAQGVDPSSQMRGARAWIDFVGMIRDPKWQTDKEGALYQALYQNGFIKGPANLPALPPEFSYPEDQNPAIGYIKAREAYKKGGISADSFNRLKVNFYWRIEFWKKKVEAEKLRLQAAANAKAKGVPFIEGLPVIP